MTLHDLVEIDLVRSSANSDSGDESTVGLRMVKPLPGSFELAFDELYRPAYRIAYRIVGDRLDAEDVAQETLARRSLRWSKLHERPES
jgi:hypothetical protein